MVENDDDYALALSLQEELDDSPVIQECFNENSSSIIDNFWELNDPNPDIHGLFLEFNSNYFWNKLNGVEVKWSSRMTLCAGVCAYEGHGGLCSIRLSLPLLKLRPRKDLVETLLHEMIHAYLFVTRNNKDHDSHGPEFLKHMFRINKLTGANVTVYHSFHDEVNSYRRHWWRCNGPCRKKPPFYGIVRRAMNRAPSSNDYWWAEHEKTCSGVFMKIKEPQNIAKRKPKISDKSSASPKKSKVTDIRTFFKSEANEKKEITEKMSFDAIKGRLFSDNGNTSNIHTLNNQKDKNYHKFPIVPFRGKGNTLGSFCNDNSSKTSKLLSLYCFDETSDRVRSHSESNRMSTSGFSMPDGIKSKSVFSSLPLSNIAFQKKPSSTSKLLDQDRTQPEVINLVDTPNSSKIKIKSIYTATPLNHIKDIWEQPSTSSSITRSLSFTQTKLEKYRTQIVGKNTKSLFKEEESQDASCKVIVTCPVCLQHVVDTEINNHLDNCLS